MNTTSWLGIFGNGSTGSTSAPLAVEAIEIPILQRDYAQGRNIGKITRIRKDFLDVLHDALVNDASVTLDFVYGDIDNGKLTLLDGQQRLTTLFLLHWYIAACELVTEPQVEKLTKFSYETRPSARDFCQQLAQARPPVPRVNVREWLEDQSWFAHNWHLDATVQAMLVMLDAIQDRFGACGGLWPRLADPNSAAVRFHFLPLADMGLSDDLYIKMNSRGKPLTEFENFKARFEQLLQSSDPIVHKEFTEKIDGPWTDLLWKGGASSVDDSFLRYFRFVSTVVEMRSSPPGVPPLELGDDFELAERVYGADNANAAEHRRYLIDALDAWCVVDPAVGHVANENVTQFFAKLFCTGAGDPARLRMFELHTNPLQACFELYGTLPFSRGDELVLAGIVEYLVCTLRNGDASSQRLAVTKSLTALTRRLRNLVVNSTDEFRPKNIADLHREVATLAQTGKLDGVVTFNKRQIAQEKAKRMWRKAHPDQTALLHAVDDHDLLRGNLDVLDLSATEFANRAEVFLSVFSESASDWMALGAALLACGNYSGSGKYGARQFGSPESPAVWRGLLTASVRSGSAQTAAAVRQLLDKLATAPECDSSSRLKAVADTYVADCMHASRFDWRYYFIRYSVMRSGKSGLYYWSNDFDLRMMTKEKLNSRHRDPYLSAALATRRGKNAVSDEFKGDGSRWLVLPMCGIEISCCQDGYLLRNAPGGTGLGYLLWNAPRGIGLVSFQEVLSAHGVIAEDMDETTAVDLLPINGSATGGLRVDHEDRVEKCARLLDALIGDAA